MTPKTLIAVLASVVAITALGLWGWIARVILPRNPQRYLLGSLMYGALLSLACLSIAAPCVPLIVGWCVPLMCG